MRQFLQGRPSLIVGAGVVLMMWGFVATYLVIATAYGGFLHTPIPVQMTVFGFTGGIFTVGLALATFGSYRICRSLRSS
jgi:hypothetical protein